MAFVIKTDIYRVDSFPPLVAGGNQPGLYLHATADTAATVAGVGYFNAGFEQLIKGTVIISLTSTGGTPVTTIRTVTANAAGVVTIA